ncbi:hypothetical protein [Streptomyces sp. MAR4 CNX-425]
MTTGSVGTPIALGGQVDHHDKARADAAINVRGGGVELVDPQTWNPITGK